MHGARSLHMNSIILHYFRTWELLVLRRIARYRRKATNLVDGATRLEHPGSYAIRRTRQIDLLFTKLKQNTLYEQLANALFRESLGLITSF